MGDATIQTQNLENLHDSGPQKRNTSTEIPVLRGIGDSQRNAGIEETLRSGTVGRQRVGALIDENVLLQCPSLRPRPPKTPDDRGLRDQQFSCV